MSQKESWEKEFEKVMGCIPECANGLYEDVGCPAHGYDAIKAIKFFRGVLSNREKEIAEEVEKMREVCHEPTNDSVENARREKWNLIITGKNLVVDRVLSIINKHQ